MTTTPVTLVEGPSTGLFTPVEIVPFEMGAGSGIFSVAALLVEDPMFGGLFSAFLLSDESASILSTSVWTVDLCRDGMRIGELSGDAYAFGGLERFREPGEWSLSFPENAPSWSSYTNTAGFVVPYGPRHVESVRLVENGFLRYAGYVSEISTGTGGAERLLDANGAHWTLSGPDLWDLLNRRVAFPAPETATPSSWAADHDVNTGVASTVLASYLSDNLGATAIADRRVTGFTINDTFVGDSGTWSARLQPLADLAKRILEDADINLRFVAGFDGSVTAIIDIPRDLSDLFVLSDQGDLTSVKFRSVPPRSTWVVAGGDGTGTGRTFRTSDSGVVGDDRRERFVDVSSLNQASEVQATATANRRIDAATWVVSGVISTALTDDLGIGRTVFVGDKLAIETNGVRYTVPVTSIAWSVTAERQTVTAALGDATPDALRGLLRDVADLAGRFDNNIA